MLSFAMYNFCGDLNALDPYPTSANNFTNTELSNGIFDHINIVTNVTDEYSKIPPTSWDFDTILDCKFENNISGGNIADLTTDVTAIRIKRREKGTFDWVTIKEITINSEDDLHFAFTDNLNLNWVEYEYAFVPVMNITEGNYVVQDVWSEFNGVYICDVDTVYKFTQGVQYNTNDMNQQVGIFTPFGRKYPVVMSNSLMAYQTGSITGMVLPENFEQTGNISRDEIVAQRNSLLNFLTNKKAKIIKDWNGNAWLCFITDKVSTSYSKGYGMGMLTMTANWTEVGDVRSKEDLYNNGMIPTGD